MGTLIRELTHASIYKRSQGRITRQVTFAALAIGLALGCWRLHATLSTWNYDATVLGLLSYGVPALLLACGVWVSYRLVNIPGFADFLIAVEAEVNKVSWPSRSELIRSSIVVLITIFVLAAVLALFDLFWAFVFRDILRLM